MIFQKSPVILENHRWRNFYHRWFLKFTGDFCRQKLEITGDFINSPVIFQKSPVIKMAKRWFCEITGDCRESPVILWNILNFRNITSWNLKITGDFFFITGDFEKSPVKFKNHRWFCRNWQKSPVILIKLTEITGNSDEIDKNHRWFFKENVSPK